MYIHCKNEETLIQKCIYNGEKQRKFKEFCEFNPSKVRFQTINEHSLQK